MGKTGFWILISVHLMGVFAATIALFLLGSQAAGSYLVGGITCAINLYILGLALKTILVEKSVAWATLLVVFKYAILGYFIYYLVDRKSIDVLAFALGIGTLSLTGPIAAVIISKLARGTNGSL